LESHQGQTLGLRALAWLERAPLPLLLEGAEDRPPEDLQDLALEIPEA
jgi:hypothetical protein